mmetsp:Transcript_8414/g.33244  ORF Transcript_8414/g.33244 Transcript_8414/m.33244 type:complete len:239 (+) Transcript_8414:339-1055(+)
MESASEDPRRRHRDAALACPSPSRSRVSARRLCGLAAKGVASASQSSPPPSAPPASSSRGASPASSTISSRAGRDWRLGATCGSSCGLQRRGSASLEASSAAVASEARADGTPPPRGRAARSDAGAAEPPARLAAEPAGPGAGPGAGAACGGSTGCGLPGEAVAAPAAAPRPPPSSAHSLTAPPRSVNHASLRRALRFWPGASIFEGERAAGPAALPMPVRMSTVTMRAPSDERDPCS